MFSKLGSRLIAAGLALVLPLSFSACSQPAPKPPTLTDYAYSGEVGFKGKWLVRFNGLVEIEVDGDGTVNVYGKAERNSSNQLVKPKVKVSGTGAVFRVYGCDNVFADNGTTVHAYTCDRVQASGNTTIYAYNCGVVRALPTVKLVETHGGTAVEKIPAPESN